jgi:hypothetical protein
MQKIMGKILFDIIAFVPETDNKIVKAVTGINFHNMPENRSLTDLDHRLWLQMRLFAYAGAESSGKNDNFQSSKPPFSQC